MPGPAADVSLVVEGLGPEQESDGCSTSGSMAITATPTPRGDDGVPAQPSSAQYAELEKASELAAVAGPSNVDVSNGSAKLAFSLPRQGVSLLVLEW